jgi:hypothetical protein
MQVDELGVGGGGGGVPNKKADKKRQSVEKAGKKNHAAIP